MLEKVKKNPISIIASMEKHGRSHYENLQKNILEVEIISKKRAIKKTNMQWRFGL